MIIQPLRKIIATIYIAAYLVVSICLLTKLSRYITLAQGHVSRPLKVLSFKCINCNFGYGEIITPSSDFVFQSSRQIKKGTRDFAEFSLF